MEQLITDLIYASKPLLAFFTVVIGFALLLYFVGSIGPDNVKYDDEEYDK